MLANNENNNSSIDMASRQHAVQDSLIKLLHRQFDKEFDEAVLDQLFASLSTEYVDKIEIIMRLEDEFSVQITDDEVDSIVAVRDIVLLVHKKIEAV